MGRSRLRSASANAYHLPSPALCDLKRLDGTPILRSGKKAGCSRSYCNCGLRELLCRATTGITQPLGRGRGEGIMEGSLVIEFDVSRPNSNETVKRSLMFFKFSFHGVTEAITILFLLPESQ